VTVTTDRGVEDTASAEVTVVEPGLEVVKTVLPLPDPVDAGDTINYQVVITNNGTSTAFDVVFLDAAPVNTDFVGTVTAVDGAGNAVGTFTISPDGQLITGTGFNIRSAAPSR
jgi:uncharacterized repeat protein (TIGR01451 family)